MDVKKYKEDFGPDLGETLFYVHIHWCRLFTIFSQYANLFGKDKERVDLLNDSTGPFFKNVQDTFHDEILLGICRLTDPAEARVKKDIQRNISVSRLAELIKDPTVSEKITKLAKEAKLSAGFAREQRNKKISHSDLDVATGYVQLESGASIIQMRTAIKAIHEVILEIFLDIRDVQTAPFVISSRSEFSLLCSLYVAQKEKEDFIKKAFENNRGRPDVYPDWLLKNDEEQNWKM